MTTDIHPEEDDWSTDGTVLWSLAETDNGSWFCHKLITDSLDDDYKAHILALMEERGYWPNVWWIDDHGGMELVIFDHNKEEV